MLVTLKVENEAGWKFHLKVCQITHKSIFARGHNLRKKNAEYSHQIRIFDIQESPGKYSNIRISVPRLSQGFEQNYLNKKKKTNITRKVHNSNQYEMLLNLFQYEFLP